MLDKLYFDDLLIGEIECLEGEFPEFNGRFKLLLTQTTEDVSAQILQYISLSVRQAEFYTNRAEEIDDDDNDESDDLEQKLLDEELELENLINSESWKIIEHTGRITKILVPTFDSENSINWRFNLG